MVELGSKIVEEISLTQVNLNAFVIKIMLNTLPCVKKYIHGKVVTVDFQENLIYRNKPHP